MPRDLEAIATHDGAAFADTEVLRRRAESLAKESVEEDGGDKVSYLLFRIGEEWYAVAVTDVSEIFQEYEVTRIPCVPAFIRGVINVRGEILSVTDPAVLMGIGRITEPAQGVPPVVVVADDEVSTAIAVDEIGDIVECSSEELDPPISTIDRTQAEFIAGSLHVGDAMVGLLSIERVLEPVVSGARFS